MVGAGVAVGRGALRPFNPFRDMPAVTSLLVRVFGAELQSDAIAGWRSLSWIARHPEMSWLWLGFDAWFDGELAGFVWLEDGRVVGNANVAPAGAGGRQWVVSNVAVEPAFRGRGIAGSLLRACLDHAGSHGARKLLLQVWAKNAAARHLYERQGFRIVSHFERLECSPAAAKPATGETVPSTYHWRPARARDYHALAGVSACLMSHEAQVLRPSMALAFREGSWDWLRSLAARLGLAQAVGREVLCEGEAISGALAMCAPQERRSRLAALLLPSAEERLAVFVAERAAALAARAQAERVTCDLPGSLPRLADELAGRGFARVDSLLQMVLELGS